MNWTRLVKRIRNLDSLYLASDRFTTAWMEAPYGSEERRELQKLADKFWDRYATLRDDRRKTSA